MTSRPDPQAARAGLYPTLWPSEHTDLWRTHTVLDAGLPAGFDPARLAVAHAEVDLPVWGYTRDRDQVFVTGGSPVMLDVFTKMIIAGKQLPIGGEPRGAGPTRHVPLVARIDPATMAKQVVYLEHGTTVNYTGGLVMHANGYVYAVAQSVLYKIDASSMAIVAHRPLPLVGSGAEQYFTVYNGMQVIGSGDLVLKGFDLISNAVEGWLILADPRDLTLRTVQPARVSSPRLTIDQHPGGDAMLYLLDAELSTRYLISGGRFVPDPAWKASYRIPGSTQASSPVLFGDHIAFSDNTSPVAETEIRLFSQPVSHSPGRLPPQRAFGDHTPGINFFMIGGDPFLTRLAIVFDPINGYVAAHQLTESGRFEPRWERRYKASASPALVPDRGHLYIDDYRDGRDHLIVLELATGRELARVALPATEPTVGCIFVGMNADVYLLSTETGGPTGFVSRVHVRAA